MILKKTIIFSLSMLTATVSAQTVIPLYPGGIPNAVESENLEKADTRKTLSKVSVPSLTVFLPKEHANGTAVLICPGGGYAGLAIEHEGYRVAEEFNKIGVTAFVLKYRLPDDRIMKNKETGPLQDALQAMRILREKADIWKINPSKTGIMGFSAGGHLASSVGTKFNSIIPGFNTQTNLRPDFMMLIYPVISFSDSLTHKGSRTNLVGINPSAEKIAAYSSERNVTPQTPPAFLVHAGNDTAVKVGNSIQFYEALLKQGVLAELHIYARGGHGFGLINPTTPDSWFEHCKNWMKANGWL